MLAGIHVLLTALNLSSLMEHGWVRVLFDMTGEATVVAWLSSATLLVTGGLIALCGAAANSATERLGWWVIAAGFVVLSIDETAGLHEAAGALASRGVTVDWLPGSNLWVLVVAPVAAVGAGAMLWWFRRCVGWSSLAGRLALGAVALWVLVPIAEGFAPSLGMPRGLIVLEETLEGLGEALMFGASLILVAGRARPALHPLPPG